MKNSKKSTVIGCLLLLVLVIGILAVFIFGRNKQSEEQIAEEEGFTKYDVIANAFGAIDKKEYTNSLEALNASYDKGIRVFEGDFCYLSDGTLVLRHDWTTDFEQKALNYMLTEPARVDAFGYPLYDEKVLPNVKKFKKNKMYGKYTPMTFDDLADWMKEHKDAYIVCDVHQNVKRTYEGIYRTLSAKDEELLSQVVAECYNEEEIKILQKICNFENIMIRKNPGNALTFQQLVNLVRDYKNIKAVAVSTDYTNDYGNLRLRSNGVKLYWDTVDDEKAFREDYSIDGIISNTLSEKEVQ